MESEKIKIKKTGKIEKILENQPWGFNSQIKGILEKQRMGNVRGKISKK